jgi:hypothetical protein
VSSVPPPWAVCVYDHTLKAGMRVPLHGFFCQKLAHFGIAPAQLTHNGWRIMVGFLALCHSAGVPLPLAVFRHFFMLSTPPAYHRRLVFRHFFMLSIVKQQRKRLVLFPFQG